MTRSTYWDHIKAGIILASNRGDHRKHVIKDYTMKAIARATPTIEVEGEDGIRYFIDTRDKGVSWPVYLHGSFEADVMDTIVRRLEMETGRTLAGRTFVDIGANIGTSTALAMIKYSAARAIAFEPVPRNFDLLRLTVMANRLEDRVELHQLALSDSEGMTAMALSPTNMGDNRIRRLGTAHFEQNESQWRMPHAPMIDVPMLPLDCVEIDFNEVSMVWMDVQGHEGHVLAGANKLLSSGVPILTEYMPYMLKEAGGLDMFHDVVCAHFSRVIDCRHGDASAVPIGHIRVMAQIYKAEFTDVLLLP